VLGRSRAGPFFLLQELHNRAAQLLQQYPAAPAAQQRASRQGQQQQQQQQQQDQGLGALPPVAAAEVHELCQVLQAALKPGPYDRSHWSDNWDQHSSDSSGEGLVSRKEKHTADMLALMAAVVPALEGLVGLGLQTEAVELMLAAASHRTAEQVWAKNGLGGGHMGAVRDVLSAVFSCKVGVFLQVPLSSKVPSCHISPFQPGVAELRWVLQHRCSAA
jgi:hypothetical protein